MNCSAQCLRASIPALIALACLAIHPVSQAGTRPDKKLFVGSVRVAYADLDLNRPADAEALLFRVKQAAFHACGGDPRRHASYDVMPNHVQAVFKECREDAVARAIATIQTPALAQALVTSPSR